MGLCPKCPKSGKKPADKLKLDSNTLDDCCPALEQGNKAFLRLSCNAVGRFHCLGHLLTVSAHLNSLPDPHTETDLSRGFVMRVGQPQVYFVYCSAFWGSPD